MIEPFLGGKTTYCRLFPPIQAPFEYRTIRSLARSMRRDSTRIPLAPDPPKVAYTYFGQFIMHDITRDDTPLRDKTPFEPPDIPNHRTPFLDLDSVYGDGPYSPDCDLYEDDHITFRTGEVLTPGKVLFDVPICQCSGRAMIADSRNNENLIIRQIHAMFLRLHNTAVAQMKDVVPLVSLFEKARERVRWQYQWLVQKDFLEKVCKASVYQDIVRQGRHCIDWDSRFAIPIEFAHAIGRFGHSMVRAFYDLNGDNTNLPLEEMFSAVHKRGPLDPNLAADWVRLVLKRGANSIDTTVVKALFRLGPKAVRPFVEHLGWFESLQLPIRTLYRHIRLHLPSGEEIREYLAPGTILAAPSPGSPHYSPNYKPLEVLETLHLGGRTPLWYYILLEAELDQFGAKLGELGSRLLAEVLQGSLRATPKSILDQLKDDPNWRPQCWDTPSGPIPIDNLFDLAVVLRLA